MALKPAIRLPGYGPRRPSVGFCPMMISRLDGIAVTILASPISDFRDRQGLCGGQAALARPTEGPAPRGPRPPGHAGRPPDLFEEYELVRITYDPKTLVNLLLSV